ncbi:Acyl-coenzyme A oxidase 2, peroxisomal-like protein [Drosera capensis]
MLALSHRGICLVGKPAEHVSTPGTRSPRPIARLCGDKDVTVHVLFSSRAWSLACMAARHSGIGRRHRKGGRIFTTCRRHREKVTWRWTQQGALKISKEHAIHKLVDYLSFQVRNTVKELVDAFDIPDHVTRALITMQSEAYTQYTHSNSDGYVSLLIRSKEKIDLQRRRKENLEEEKWRIGFSKTREEEGIRGRGQVIHYAQSTYTIGERSRHYELLLSLVNPPSDFASFKLGKLHSSHSSKGWHSFLKVSKRSQRLWVRVREVEEDLAEGSMVGQVGVKSKSAVVDSSVPSILLNFLKSKQTDTIKGENRFTENEEGNLEDEEWGDRVLKDREGGMNQWEENNSFNGGKNNQAGVRLFFLDFVVSPAQESEFCEYLKVGANRILLSFHPWNTRPPGRSIFSYIKRDEIETRFWASINLLRVDYPSFCPSDSSSAVL